MRQSLKDPTQTRSFYFYGICYSDKEGLRKDGPASIRYDGSLQWNCGAYILSHGVIAYQKGNRHILIDQRGKKRSRSYV